MLCVSDAESSTAMVDPEDRPGGATARRISTTTQDRNVRLDGAEASVLFLVPKRKRSVNLLFDRASIALLLSAFLLSSEPVTGYQSSATTALLFRPASSTTETSANRRVGRSAPIMDETTQQPADRLRLPYAPSILFGDSESSMFRFRTFVQRSSSSSPSSTSNTGSATSMFLTTGGAETFHLPQQRRRNEPTSTKTAVTPKSPIALTQQSDGLPRNRGILGFQIHSQHEEMEEHGIAADWHPAQPQPHSNTAGMKSTRLRMGHYTPSSSSSSSHSRTTLSRVSKVDSNAWNLPEPLSLDAADAYSITTTSSSSNTPTTSTRPVTAIPWIPSDEEVESLTVVQLKAELEARGLTKTGRKLELQFRLREWSETQQQRRRSASSGSTGDILSSLNLQQAYSRTKSSKIGASSSFSSTNTGRSQLPRLEANSLAEWARTVDLEPLLQRREEIHREKLEGKKTTAAASSSNAQHVTHAVLPDDYLAVLNNVFEKPSSVSNRDVKQMYAAAKQADQMGDRQLSKRILLELKRVTPHDARIYRRLARLENEQGNLPEARAVLQEGLDLHPDNGFLWHGLGQLEVDMEQRKRCFAKAIAVDPSLPHSYHALGTLEHLQGRVANAMKTLKQGIEHCRTNHRLHHALGDLYRDAKMLDMAEASYRRALQYSPYTSHGFAYTALAYTAYERGEVEQCRRWLYKAVRQHNGRHANAWVALAQLEEAEGNIDAARSACIAGIAQYERGLLERSKKAPPAVVVNDQNEALLLDPKSLKHQFLQQGIPSYRSGDRFFNVYRNWLRLEERYGTLETMEEVYDRASVAFPGEWKMALDAAQYYVKLDLDDRARTRLTEACNRAGSQHADPYRLFAEFEMSHGNFEEAQRILYLGANVMLRGSDSSAPEEDEHAKRGETPSRGQADLFLTWAVCEWHLGDIANAVLLTDHALELTTPTASPDDQSAKLRSLILYTRARLEYFCGEHRLAQHYIGLCLAEAVRVPHLAKKVWSLWAAVGHELGDARLAQQCQEQATNLDEEQNSNSSVEVVLKGADLQHMMRRDPWHTKIFGGSESHDKLMSVALLPEKDANSPRTKRRPTMTGNGV